MPKATLGLTNTFEYKRFTLRILADGRLGGVIVSGTEMNLAASGITEETAKYREGGLDLHGVDAEGNPVNKTIDAQHFWKAASGQRYGVAEFFAYNATNFRVRELILGVITFHYRQVFRSRPHGSRLWRVTCSGCIAANRFSIFRA